MGKAVRVGTVLQRVENALRKLHLCNTYLSNDKFCTSIKQWLETEYRLSQLEVKRISFDQSRQWRWDRHGYLSHVNNRFFRIVGVNYFSHLRQESLSQPIIDQPEIGLLSFLVCKENDEWWILAHAKVEPGNVNGVQLAPTVQATKSNYEIAHGGSPTPYLSIVQSAPFPLYNRLQSEQNSRFLAKRNRNSVVCCSERVTAADSRYRWIQLRELLPLLGQCHVVNTDARSVLVSWLLTDGSALKDCFAQQNGFKKKILQALNSEVQFHKDHEIEEWIVNLNATYKTETRVIALNDLDHPWTCSRSEIMNPTDPSLMIYQIEVQCAKREVSQWDQPIAGSNEDTRIVLITGSFRGTLHLLLQARLEAGNRSGFELTATVQSEWSGQQSDESRCLQIAAECGKVIHRFDNSEEGGRFDRCVSRYEIVWIGEIDPAQEGPFHRWISLSQFAAMLNRENRITNELRSAASSLLGIEMYEI